MKTTFLILTTLFVSVWLCAGSERTLLNLQRHRRSISESTRFHNEYQRSERNNYNDLTIPPSTASTPSCVPGTRWRNDCNNCWCLATGAEACTLLRCPKFTVVNEGNGKRTVTLNSIQEHSGKRSRVRRADDAVKPRSSTGPRSSNNTGRRVPSSASEPCVNGSRWMDKCNSCRCFNGHAACTRMRCRDD